MGMQHAQEVWVYSEGISHQLIITHSLCSLLHVEAHAEVARCNADLCHTVRLTLKV